MLTEAGFERVDTDVRHFWPSDTFVTAMLEQRLRPLRDPRVLDRIGRLGGWYVIGRGFRGA
jgi:hypothetical protein